MIVDVKNTGLGAFHSADFVGFGGKVTERAGDRTTSLSGPGIPLPGRKKFY